MGLGKSLGRAAIGWSTGGLSEVYRALRPGGGSAGYSALPFENPSFTVDEGRIRQEFLSSLGRQPTQNEIDQYARHIKTGDLSYGDLGYVLQAMPEADRARLDTNAAAYSEKLGAQNQAILDRTAATVNSRFAGLGRPVSSGMAASMLQAGGNLALQQQSALAEFYGRGLQNNQNQYLNRGESALARAYQLQDDRSAFNRGLLGYQTQRNDFNTDLSNENARRKQQAYNELIFGVIGAGVGGKFGGVEGARLGAGVGSKAGGLF